MDSRQGLWLLRSRHAKLTHGGADSLILGQCEIVGAHQTTGSCFVVAQQVDDLSILLGGQQFQNNAAPILRKGP